MPLLNYTTSIDVEKTIGEIQKMLSKHQAQKIMTDYDGEGSVTSLSFAISLNGTLIGFRLPCDWRPVLELMQNDPKVPQRLCTQDQAVRVAWRILKDWCEAQMALIDTKMVKTEEVFLPYAVGKDGKTFFQQIEQNPTLLLN